MDIKLPFDNDFFHCIEADPPWRYRDRNFNGYESVQKYRIHCSYPTMPTSEIVDMGGEIKRVSSDQCHLWLWSTKDFLAEAFQVMWSWGFDFKQIFTWIKTSKDLGDYMSAIVKDLKKAGITFNVRQRQKFCEIVEHRTEDCLKLTGKPTYGMGYWGRNGCEFLLFGTNNRSNRPKNFTKTPNYFFAPRPRIQRKIIDENGELKEIIRQHSYKPEKAYDIIRTSSPGPRLSLFQRRYKKGFRVWGNEIEDRNISEQREVEFLKKVLRDET